MSKTADDSQFDQIVEAEPAPVLVDFWAPWCKPCAAIAPILEEAEAASNGQFAVVKVNIDECEGLAARFNVKSLPTLLLITKEGRQFRKVGNTSRRNLEDWIHSALA